MLREVLYFEDVVYRIESLMVYGNIRRDGVMLALKEVSEIIAYDPKLKGINEKYYTFATSLLAKAEELGLSGNLIRQYAMYLFLTDENLLSLACENNTDVKSSTLHQMALKDMGVLQYFMDFDLKNLCENIGYGENLYDYTPTRPREYPELDLLNTCQSAAELLERLIWQYSRMGCGKPAAANIFRIDEAGGLVEIRNSNAISFGGVYGCKRQIDDIKANTEAFLEGKPARNLLLTGSRGIGKYTCLRALSYHFSDRGLRMIEAGKSDFRHLNRLLAELGARNRRFIILADELSARDVAENYDSLKICLGASLEHRPENVLFYAAGSGDYPVDYFDGVIDFAELDENEFQELTADIAKRLKVAVPEDFLKRQALAWAADTRERSVKTAREFIRQVMWELEQS